MGVSDQVRRLREELPAQVRLVAVSKQVPVDLMREAYVAGIRDFGESRIQEARQKLPQLAGLEGISWHLIGTLQSNKVRPALELFDWIHSVDSWSLAERVNMVAAQLSRRPKLLLQVKLTPDPDKSGWLESALWEALPRLAALPQVEIRGLMAIAPLGLDPIQTRDLFGRVAQLADSIRQKASAAGWGTIRMEELSMGMSGDYPSAVQAGATMVRLGQIVFGSRLLPLRENNP
ncbi:MAG: YggS family pyridoxal phosphate-dependent enzyme [Gemmatimonadaceae bacterium]|nr:YggS family pyridoxal phosphate-dependent enzyme [Gloeobacterales cyanobacterium ES-bin-141]